MSENPDSESHEDRRQQGIKIPVPWSKDPIEIRGLTTIMALLLVLTGVNTWIGWTLVQEFGKVGDSMIVMARAQNLSSCVIVELDPARRKERYDECLRWFGREPGATLPPR